MTKEEAIRRLFNIERCTPIHTREDERDFEALEMAIKALEQEPSGDLISRQAAIDALTKTSGIRGDALKALYDLPSVKQEPKTGHWMIVHRKSIYAHLVCDKCLSNAPYDCRTNYCPNCGAKMVEQERSEE